MCLKDLRTLVTFVAFLFLVAGPGAPFVANLVTIAPILLRTLPPEAEEPKAQANPKCQTGIGTPGLRAPKLKVWGDGYGHGMEENHVTSIL